MVLDVGRRTVLVHARRTGGGRSRTGRRSARAARIVGERPPDRVADREHEPAARPEHPAHLPEDGRRRRPRTAARRTPSRPGRRARRRTAAPRRRPAPRGRARRCRGRSAGSAQLPVRQVEGRDLGPLADQPRPHCAAPQPISSTRRPRRRRAGAPRPRRRPRGTRRSRRPAGTRRARPGSRRRCRPTSRGWPARCRGIDRSRSLQGAQRILGPRGIRAPWASGPWASA